MNLTTDKLVKANQSIRAENHILKVKIEVQSQDIKHYLEENQKLKTHIEWLNIENDFLMTTVNALKQFAE